MGDNRDFEMEAGLTADVALLEGSAISSFPKHQKITGREEGFIPAPLSSDSLDLTARGERG